MPVVRPKKRRVSDSHDLNRRTRSRMAQAEQISDRTLSRGQTLLSDLREFRLSSAPSSDEHGEVFCIDQIFVDRPDENKVFTLQFLPVRVEISRSDGVRASIACSCNPSHTHSSCPHVLHVLDHVARILRKPIPSRDGDSGLESSGILNDCYNLIAERPSEILLNVASQIGSFGPQAHSSILTDPSAVSRRNILCNILSSFDDQLMPQDFDRDFARRVSSTTPLNTFLQPGNLYGTLYQIAMVSNPVFTALNSAVPPAFRVDRLHAKLYSKSIAAIEEFDERYRAGTVAPAILVKHCAETLREIVRNLSVERLDEVPLTGGSWSPTLTSAQGRRLGEILVSILQAVCRRDKDLRVGSRPRARSQKHNLFTYLIGDPIFELPTPVWMQQPFVVGQLRKIPSQFFQHLSGILISIREEVAETSRPYHKGSLAFVQELTEVLRGCGNTTMDATWPVAQDASSA